MRPGRVRAPRAAKGTSSSDGARRPGCAAGAHSRGLLGPLKLRVWPPLGCCAHSSNWLGARMSPSSRFRRVPVLPQSGNTEPASPRAFQGLSGYDGRKFPAVVRELRSESQGRVPMLRLEGLLIFAAQPWAQGRRGDVPARTLRLEAGGRGQPGPVGREGSQVWS